MAQHIVLHIILQVIPNKPEINFLKNLPQKLFALFSHSQKQQPHRRCSCESKGKINKVADSVAQLVEQYTFNVWVLGSSPSGITG